MIRRAWPSSLAPLGYAAGGRRRDDADMVILNTCHIREKAAEKVFSELGSIRRLKTAKARARRPHDRRGRRLRRAGRGRGDPAPRAVCRHRVRPADLSSPARDDRARDRAPAAASSTPSFPPKPNSTTCPRPPRAARSARFLSVQEGCDKFCTLLRRPLYARRRVLAPGGASARRGASGWSRRERARSRCSARTSTPITATAPTAASGAWRDLIRALAEIPGLDRLRYTTSHPRDVDDELIAAHRDVPQLMPFLHLPVQSGSDRVLAAMNRRHTADDYRRIVDRLRAARPDLALSSDFIVGYPGRKRRGFRAPRSTSSREIGFAQAFSFKYSPRPGTPAAPPRSRCRSRSRPSGSPRCRRCFGEQQRAFNDACVGRVLPVLFEKPGRHEGQLVGRSPYLQRVHADGAAGSDRRDRAGAASSACGRQQPRRDHRRDRRGSGAMSVVSPDLAAGRRAASSSSTTICCCPCSTASAISISTASSGSSASSLVPRGNRLAISGPASATEVARIALSHLYERLKQGQEVDAAAVDAAMRLAQTERDDKNLSLWREDAGVPHPQAPHRRALGGPGAYIKAMREHELVFGLGPGRHRQDLSRGRRRGRPADDRPGRAHHPVAPGGRGRRAARLPARRSAREGRSLSAADLRRAQRHAAGRPAGQAARHRRDRGRAARLHARPHPGARLRHPRRGAEHDAGADEDVPDPARRGLAHGGDRRSDPDRSAARRRARASPTRSRR